MGGRYNKQVQLDSARRHGYAAQVEELEGQKTAAKKTAARKGRRKTTKKTTAKKTTNVDAAK